MAVTLELLSAVLCAFTSLTVVSCALLAAAADGLISPQPFSDFEEA